MKKWTSILILLLLGALSASAQYFEGFSVKSYRITTAYPTSFRSVKGVVSATVGNTADTRTMSGIHATVYRSGRRFAYGNCDDITFYQGVRNYTLRGQISLAEGISTWDAIRAAFSFRADEYTLDFTITITHADGRQDHVVRTGVPLSNYLR